jgi:hypothetical protein
MYIDLNRLQIYSLRQQREREAWREVEILAMRTVQRAGEAAWIKR